MNTNNKTETFSSFNKGMKRQDRKRHMELCGFTLSCSPFNPKDEGYKSPKLAAKYRAKVFNEKNNKSAHVVYFSSCRNSWGLHLYDFWIKVKE